MPESKRKGPRYTPVSKRQDRPNAILWLVRNHPELKDAQISRLVGTTKSTIEQIRERTHWNSANLAAMDPVTLGLCSQIDLDLEVEKASKGRPLPTAEELGATLQPARETSATLTATTSRKKSRSTRMPFSPSSSRSSRPATTTKTKTISELVYSTRKKKPGHRAGFFVA